MWIWQNEFLYRPREILSVLYMSSPTQANTRPAVSTNTSSSLPPSQPSHISLDTHPTIPLPHLLLINPLPGKNAENAKEIPKEGCLVSCPRDRVCGLISVAQERGVEILHHVISLIWRMAGEEGSTGKQALHPITGRVQCYSRCTDTVLASSSFSHIHICHWLYGNLSTCLWCSLLSR